jgi:hypothetical protein
MKGTGSRWAGDPADSEKVSWWTTLADGGLPHNHHKPRLAGYELGGSQ